MCGITGFFSYKNKVDTKKYYDAHVKIAHRGPDDEGFIYKNDQGVIEHLRGDDTINDLKQIEHILHKGSSTLILGHRRLSIIDLTSHGHQPFSYDNLYLVYNGEIFNYVELREELKEYGYTFETDSDTEVFIKAYHYWQEYAFNKFNGMWSAAIYDLHKNSIVLTRDRFGIKPLYYSFINNNLIFGSEIKFVASFFDQLQANNQMIYEYLRFNRIDHTNQTLFKNIYQLEPNSYMEHSESSTKIEHYWSLEEVNTSKGIIEELLNNAISLRMRSDVEVGSLLSGGIDSSTILGILNDSKQIKNFKTFSAVFKEEEFSEKKYIDKFETNNINLEKHFIYPNPENLIKIINNLIYTQEEPFRSLAVFSQYEIYQYIKRNTNTTVLLNGQGADEIFTGYTEFYYIYLIELLRSFNIKLFISEFNAFKRNRNISSIHLVYQLIQIIASMLFRKNDKYHIFKRSFEPIKFTNKFTNKLKNSLWENLTFSALREYLRYEDKNSMQFSLESRLPFLDYRLVQNAFSLPNEQKINNGISKYILREIAKGKIPDITLYRKDKMGFVSPQEVWQKTVLSTEFNKVFEDILTNGLFDFIDNKKIYSLYMKYQKSQFTDWAFIWRIYCLSKWKKVWNIE